MNDNLIEKCLLKKSEITKLEIYTLTKDMVTLLEEQVKKAIPIIQQALLDVDEEGIIWLNKLIDSLPNEPLSLLEFGLIVAKAQHASTMKEFEGYVCEECSTPNFVHLVIPLRVWESLLKEIE